MSFIHKLSWFLIFVYISTVVIADGGVKRKRTPRWGSEPIINEYGDPMVATIIQGNVKSGRDQLFMFSAYYVYGETATECYLGIPQEGDLPLEKRIGWVKKEYLLLNPEALRTHFKIFRKAIVFDNKHENRIPIFDSPHNDAEEMGKTPMFTFFYIYKVIGDYYLIGLSPSVDLEYCNDEILGWIHKKTCREWNTRQAVGHERTNRWRRLQQEEKDKNGLVKVFADEIAAKNYELDAVVNEELETTVWRYNMPRYPLLESKSVKSKRLFQVAFLGGDKGSALQEVISRIKEKREQLSKVDIVFLVDASSRQNTRRQIQRAISKAIAKMKQLENPRDKVVDLQVGLIYYSDFSELQTYRYKRGKIFQPQVVRLHSLTDNIKRFERHFKRPHFYGQKEKRKSLYYAVDVAMNKRVRWRDNSSRYIIALGYSGNHDPKAAVKSDISKLEEKDIVDALKLNNVQLHGIQLPHNIEANPNSNSFVEQIAAIGGQVGSGGSFPAWNYSEGDVQNNLENVLNILFRGIKEQIRVRQQVIGDLEHGLDAQEISKRHHQKWEKFNERKQKDFFRLYIKAKAPGTLLKVSPILHHDTVDTMNKSFIEKEQISIEDFKKGGVFYDKGWTWEYNPKTNIRQMQVYLLMNKMELSRLLGFLSALLQELEQASKPEQYLEIWKTLLKTTLGIDSVPATEPLDSLMKQHTGLPFMNGLLSYTLDDFVEKARDPGFRKDLLTKLSANTNYLFDVLSDKEKERIQDKNGNVMTKARKRWWKERENELEYAWIEIELFP
ncbi:hypothetical protein [Candidatus Uabimicrobium sp. HlEnr_7]|uniref:hypothetical protein n=1 Tax=Candidatus Uabimicrobium helgolandensis TaxID=3095367 RepID=UPI003558E492